jgi:hypothetical protein
MTSLRELKKDINYLCTEFVADCYLMLHMNPGNDELIDSVADKVIDARNNLIQIIHHPENKHKRNITKDKEALKQRNREHKELISKSFEDFIKLIDNSYEEIQKLNK